MLRSSDRPPYGIAAAVAAAVLAIYVITIAPTTHFWDTSEYIAAARVLGIPHPPGNPLFVLMAHVWGELPIAWGYALRLNLFAAVTSAFSSGFLFLVAERFLRDASTAPRWTRYAAAAAGVLVGATSFTVWNQSTVNEKVYTLSLLSIALVLWLAVHWGDDEPGPHRDRWLLLMAYLLALTATNHLMGLLVGPAVLAYILYTDPQALLRWQLWAGAALVAVVGVSVWTFLPIRAGQFPAINEGEPTTWPTLKAVLNRDQYAKPPVTFRQATLAAQFANYWQYVTWQYGRDWSEPVRRLLAIGFTLLGLTGAWRQWRTDRRGAAAMTALIGTVTIVLVVYLNFRYGFSIFPDQELDREVRERDYFFIASFLLWGIWVAIGLAVLMEETAKAFRERMSEGTRWLVATPVLLVALIPLAGNRLTASRAGETTPRDFAVDLLQSVEPYAILITAGDNDTFPLWYAQEVEGVRTDVLIANQSLMNTEWHLRQLKRRPLFPFDTASAIAPYRGRQWRQPDADPFSLTYEQLDALPPGYQISQPSMVTMGKVNAMVPAGVIERTDIAALQLMKDNLGKRPIYLSRTTGNWGDRYGLTSHLLGHGLARKLMPDSIRASDSIALVPGLGYIHIPRTRTLLFDIYHADGVARDRPRGWVDVPSEGILSLYWVMYVAWTEMVKQREQEKNPRLRPDSAMVALGRRADDLAARILRNTSFGRQRDGIPPE